MSTTPIVSSPETVLAAVRGLAMILDPEFTGEITISGIGRFVVTLADPYGQGPSQWIAPYWE
jgi:hypothetical protein